MRECKMGRRHWQSYKMIAVKMIRLKLQWHVGLAEGTSKIGDTGLCWYNAENDPLDNYKSKDLQIMRENGIQGTVENTALDSSNTSITLTGWSLFQITLWAILDQLLAWMVVCIHYIADIRDKVRIKVKGEWYKDLEEKENIQHLFRWGWKWTCSLWEAVFACSFEIYEFKIKPVNMVAF